MSRTKLSVSTCVLLICIAVSVSAQQAAPAAANAVVPPVVKFSGVLNDVNNKPMTGPVGVTFSLYKDSESGAPLWMETQNVTPDKTGHYSVLLGSTTSQGLSDLFNSGEARWLGVQVEGEAEKPRTLLMSVPYALKAADAETIGGLPPSAFVKAAAPGAASPAANPMAAAAAISGTGTANHVTKWTGTSTIGNSNIWDGPNGNVGIAINSPSAKLDVNGTALIRSSATIKGDLTAGPVAATSSTSGGTGVYANAGSSTGSNGVIAVGATGVAGYTTVAGSIALYGNARNSGGGGIGCLGADDDDQGNGGEIETAWTHPGPDRQVWSGPASLASRLRYLQCRAEARRRFGRSGLQGNLQRQRLDRIDLDRRRSCHRESSFCGQEQGLVHADVACLDAGIHRCFQKPRLR